MFLLSVIYKFDKHSVYTSGAVQVVTINDFRLKWRLIHMKPITARNTPNLGIFWILVILYEYYKDIMWRYLYLSECMHLATEIF